MSGHRGDTWHGRDVRIHMNNGLWKRLEADARVRGMWSLDAYLSQVLELWAVCLPGPAACSTCSEKPWQGKAEAG